MHGYVARSTLDELASEPPAWLIQLRGDLELERVSAMWSREQERVWEAARGRADAVLRDAERVVARVPDEAVAELFGLDLSVVEALRPRSGGWTAGYVARLLATRPAWLADDRTARAEAERRAASARRRAAARQARGQEQRRDSRRKNDHDV
ncbi:hypothetical protein ACU686_34925 [Yinghuangia aomiensis]